MTFDPKQFEEELDDCGGDVGLWSLRKERENSTFFGLEIDREKEKRLNYIKGLCRRLSELYDDVEFIDYPMTPDRRNGMAQLALPWLFDVAGDALPIMSKLYAAADFATLSSPYCSYDEEIDGDDVPEKKVFISFDVLDMWNTYGKGPF